MELKLIDIFRFNMTIGGGTAFFINLLLLVAIIICQHRDIGAYQYLIFAYFFTAAVLSFITCTTAPMFTGSSGGIIFYSTVPRLPYHIGNWLLVCYSNCYAQITVILTLSFMYRCSFVYSLNSPALRLLCKRADESNVEVSNTKNIFSDPKNNWYFTWKLVPFILLCMTTTVIVYGYPVLNVLPNDFLVGLNNATVFEITGYSDSILSTIGGPPFVDGKPTVMLLCFGMYFIGVLISIVIILICVVRLNKWFNELVTETTSRRIQRVQKNFYMLLLLQTFSPLVFTYTPLLISFPLGLLKIDIPPRIHLMYSSLLPFAQVFEPLFVFMFIREYRSVFRRLLGMQKSQVYASQSSQSWNPRASSAHEMA